MDSDRYMQQIEAWLQEGNARKQTEGKTGFFSGGSLTNQQEINTWFSEWIQSLPEDKKQVGIDVLEQLIFYLSNFYQSKSRCAKIEGNIVRQAHLFDPQIERIEDMRSLPFEQAEYVDDMYQNKHLMYALAEGGVAGTGHPLLLLLDFPALLTINMNMVHYTASTYGYSLQLPQEQVLALKVLHAAALPQRYRQSAWEWIMHQYDREFTLNLSLDDQETVIQPEWLETVAKQWIKSLVLYSLNKTGRRGFSILGILFGANMNHHFTKNIARFASYFYRYRFLEERELDS